MLLKTKLFYLSGVFSIFILLLGCFNLYQMSRMDTASKDLSQNWLPSIKEAMQMQLALSDYRRNEAMFLYSTDPELSANYEKRMEGFKKDFENIKSRYEKLISSKEEKTAYDKMNFHYKTFV